MDMGTQGSASYKTRTGQGSEGNGYGHSRLCIIQDKGWAGLIAWQAVRVRAKGSINYHLLELEPRQRWLPTR
eukprot:1156677-Pelagomonas_calceolata.AAC.2